MFFFSTLKDTVFYKSIIRYPTPISLTYTWSFGVLTMIFIVLQILTGILISFYYTGSTAEAFNSVHMVLVDADFGALLYAIHSVGVTAIFICMLIHTFRAVQYVLYDEPREVVWSSGQLLFYLTMIISFLGYVLPWGQLSYWGCRVVINAVSSIDIIEEELQRMCAGGTALTNTTLARCFILHIVLPFILVGLIFLHFYFLHQVGSSVPLLVNMEATESILQSTSFHVYFIIKDLFISCFGILLFLLLLSRVAQLSGTVPLHSYFEILHNHNAADPAYTPLHIMPEWYLLLFYAELKMFSNKTLAISTVTTLLLTYLSNDEYLYDDILVISNSVDELPSFAYKVSVDMFTFPAIFSESVYTYIPRKYFVACYTGIEVFVQQLYACIRTLVVWVFFFIWNFFFFIGDFFSFLCVFLKDTITISVPQACVFIVKLLKKLGLYLLDFGDDFISGVLESFDEKPLITVFVAVGVIGSYGILIYSLPGYFKELYVNFKEGDPVAIRDVHFLVSCFLIGVAAILYHEFKDDKSFYEDDYYDDSIYEHF